MNMRNGVLIVSILSLLICVIIFPANARTEDEIKTILPGGPSGPITILSGSAEFDLNNNIMVISGPVHGTMKDMTIYCNRLEIYFKNSPESNKPDQKQGDAYGFERIERAVITGDVKINRSDGSSANGEKIVYYKTDEKLIMTGNPIAAKLGGNIIECKKITYDIKLEKIFYE